MGVALCMHHQIVRVRSQLIILFRAFLTEDFPVTRTVLLVILRALGTMVAIYIPAAPGCAWERAKPKQPVSLGGGWESAAVGGAEDFRKDLADGGGVTLTVVATR